MTIYDLMFLFTDGGMQELEIYSIEKEKSVFKGCYEDLPYEYENMEILSIDNLYGSCTLVLNIE